MTVFDGCDGCDGFPMADLNPGKGQANFINILYTDGY